MQVVLKVWSSNPDNNGGCDFAVVETTPELANQALRRIGILREQKAVDPALDETYYWDSVADFFSPWTGPVAGPRAGEAASLKLEEELDLLQIDKHEVTIPVSELHVPKNLIARVECAQMVVRETGIAFTAIPKHTDFHVTTAEILKEVLERCAPLANG